MIRLPHRLLLSATLASAITLAPRVLDAQVAVRQAPAKASFSPAAWTRRAVIYEVNVRQFTPEGTFAALEKHLPRLRALGVDVLWIMPVQPIGKASRKGGLGSPYSISDYRGINAEYGNASDFRHLVASAHQQKMRVVLDWVANHTAFDHAWITQHPDWYVHRKDGTISYARDGEGKETDWTDVAALNYDSRGMRDAMIGDMRWWLDSMHIDGFRCDVAGGPPMSFWSEARSTLQRSRPDLFMLAEAEGPKFYPVFDMTYGWEFHHLLNELAKQQKPTSEIDAYLAREAKDYPPTAYRMYFTSNHDENSWSGSEFERMGANHLPAFVLAATMHAGMPLLYTGQEASMQKRLRFFEKDTVDWSGPSLASFYRTVFALRHAEPALANGAYGGAQTKLATDGGDRVYVFMRKRGANTVLVAVNFGDAEQTLHFTDGVPVGDYTDWFSRAKVKLTSSGTLDVQPHGYRVLVR